VAGVTGDFTRLTHFHARIADIAHGDFYRALGPVMGDEAIKQIADGFIGMRNPYGDSWKPTWRGGNILRDSGQLKGIFTYQLKANGFEVGTTTIYAAVHQYGATIRPKNAKALFFRIAVGRAGPIQKSKGGRRGPGSFDAGWVTRKSVTIPRRQMVPEGVAGPIWDAAMQKAADGLVRRWMASRG
jgi:phage gpG-like protein